MKKFIIYLLAVVGIIGLVPGDTFACDLLSIETPTYRQFYDSYPVEVIIRFDHRANPDSFTARLNGRDVSSSFLPFEDGMKAMLGPEDGLKVYEGDHARRLKWLGRNIFIAKVKEKRKPHTYFFKSRFNKLFRRIKKVDVDHTTFFVQAQLKTMIEGVAAAGAPITGNVYIKDSSTPVPQMVGPLRIDIDGSFQLDVTGLTFPIYLKAEGEAANKSFELYSIVIDSGGLTTITANINPLTNLALCIAANVFDPALIWNNPSSYPITQESIDQAITDIQTFLEPLLVVHNCENVDFITDEYIADHSGLDSLFDVADIHINTSNGLVTISDNATETDIGISSITDIDSPSDVITQTEADESQDVPSLLAQLENDISFYNMVNAIHSGGGELTNADISPFIASTFGVWNGLNRDQFITYLRTYINKMYEDGRRFDKRIGAFIDGTSPYGDLIAKFKILHSDGLIMPVGFPYVWEVDKWKIKGNGYNIFTEFWSTNSKWIDIDNSERIESGFYIYIHDDVGVDIQEVSITGPGLPAGGVVLKREEFIYEFYNTGQIHTPFWMDDTYQDLTLPSGNGHFYAIPDTDIDSIPDNAEYTFESKNAIGDIVETRTITNLKPPIKRSDLTADRFPTFSVDGANSHNILFDNYQQTETFTYAKPTDPEIIPSLFRGEHSFLFFDNNNNYEKIVIFYNELLLPDTTSNLSNEYPDPKKNIWSEFKALGYDQYGRRIHSGWVYSTYGDFTPITEIPEAIITIDGSATDWAGIQPIVTDPEGDSLCGVGTDVKHVYLAVDSHAAPTKLYWRIDTYSGTYLSYPNTPQILFGNNMQNKPDYEWNDFYFVFPFVNNGRLYQFNTTTQAWDFIEVNTEYGRIGPTIAEGMIPYNDLFGGAHINYLNVNYGNLSPSWTICDPLF